MRLDLAAPEMTSDMNMSLAGIIGLEQQGRDEEDAFRAGCLPPSPMRSDTTNETAPNPNDDLARDLERCSRADTRLGPGGCISASQASEMLSDASSRAQPLSSAEASDMQAAADSYVQVILSGEAPYQIVWASEAWLKLVGYPNDEACGKTLQLVEGPLTSQASVGVLMAAIHAGHALKTQMIHHARSGRAFSHEMRVEPLKDSRGLVQCFQVTSADVQVLAPVGSAPGISAPGKSDVAKVAEPQTGRTSADLRLISAPGKDLDARLEIDEMLEWLGGGDGGQGGHRPPTPQRPSPRRSPELQAQALCKVEEE